MSTSSRIRILSAATAGVVVLILAGCAPTPSASDRPKSTTSSTPSSSPTASASASASPRPSTTANPAPGTQAVTVDCNVLVSPQAIYDFNPNFGLQVPFTPTVGSAAATAKADSGTSCNWVNQTSGDTVTVTIAKPSAADLAAIRAMASKGTPAAGLGSAAWFSTKGQSGQVDVFTGSYWLSATSVYFASASDASSLLTEALKSAR